MENTWSISERMLNPLTKASPIVTSVSPVSILNVVVFPAPLTPKII